MLLVGRQEGHPAQKLCFKTAWDGGLCKWLGIAQVTL